MCGIAGVYHKQSYTEIERMLEKIQHRGLDGQGIQNLARGTLGHRRLAISSITDIHQPLEVSGAWIVFSGEVYNFRELAREHLAEEILQVHNDIEVLVHLYLKYGPASVKLLHGMFAFAIMQEDKLFLARDPLGIKPLYFGGKEGAFYFASEIKALALMTNSIHEFPPGYWYHSQMGWHSYYEITSGAFEINTESEVIVPIRRILQDAVHLRLLADVPVGISLNGTLNSSIIAMLASQERREHLHSFAVGMQGSADLEAARETAAAFRMHHHEHIYTAEEMQAVLPKVIYHLESFDPALVRWAIPNFFLAEMAARHVKVILTGEGADEIYPGYDGLSPHLDSETPQDEMVTVISALHNGHVRYAERIPMAFGLETRLPFLDVRSLALGLAVPTEWRSHPAKAPKFLLRQAFATDLPAEILNRPNQNFSVGMGFSNAFVQMANSQISDGEFQVAHDHLFHRWGYQLPDKEALYYYKILRQNFEDRWIFPTMGHSGRS